MNFGTPVWLNVMFSAGCFCTGRAAFASKSSLHLPTWWWNFTANVLAGQKWKRMSELMGIRRLRDTGFILHNQPVGVCGTKAFHSPPRASLGLTSAYGWSSGNDTNLKQLFVSICYVERRSFKGFAAATTQQHVTLSSPSKTIQISQAAYGALLLIPRGVSQCRALWRSSLEECS